MVKRIFSACYVWIILLMLYAPIMLLVLYSFNASKEIGHFSSSWGFQYYKMLFTNEKILNAIKNTLIIAFASAIIATILGSMGAIGMYYSKKRTFKILNTATQIPIINAEIVTAISLALICQKLFFYGTYASLIIGHVVLCFPFVVTSVLPKLKQMDPSLYEAGLDLGATPLKALFTIVIPEILPGVFSGFLLAITLSLDDYIITTFNKPDNVDTISTYAYNASTKSGASNAIPSLRALSAIVFGVIIIIVITKYILDIKKAKQKEKQL